MKKVTLFALLMLLALPLSAATKKIDERRTIDSNADVEIEFIAGDIRILVGKSDELIVRGTINDSYETFDISGDDGNISIEVEPKERKQRNAKFDAQLTVTVPAGVELTIESVSGEITVDGLSNSLTIESVNGDVDVRGPLREIDIESVSGRVTIASESTLKSVSVEAVSAVIEMAGDLARNGDYSFEAVSGEITIRVPRGYSASYEIETFSGDIDNAFGPEPETTKFLPSQSLSFSESGGGANFEISCFSGKIRLLEN
jgi:DUF4097 and DUF4098 domain-containing protein YvlB